MVKFDQEMDSMQDPTETGVETAEKKETAQYNPSFVEQSIIDFWKEYKIFEKSIETKPEDNPYRFYD